MKPTQNQLSASYFDLLELEAVVITVLIIVSVIALIAVTVSRSRSIKRSDETAIRKVKEALHPEDVEDREKSEE